MYVIHNQSDPRVAQTAARVRSKRQDERNSTSSYRRRQTSWNLMVLRKVMRAGHQGGGVGGCSSCVVRQNHSVGSEFSERMRTHTHILNIGWGSLQKLSFYRRLYMIHGSGISGTRIIELAELHGNLFSRCACPLKGTSFLWRSTKQSWTSQTTRRHGLLLLLPLNHADIDM